ncbi:hypothetical protein E1162_03670 [Rhodobacteraceae bacterium RKSG542]|nr:hypothetical protein [Pseudovibrio flavus]
MERKLKVRLSITFPTKDTEGTTPFLIQSITPNTFDTPQVRGYRDPFAIGLQSNNEHNCSRIPMERYGKVEEIAATIAFLA